MTSGEGGFSYNDDSVIAKIAVEVPSTAVTDIEQIRQSAANLNTELEALTRSQGDWVGYLGQIPEIAERANQAYRSLITSMERMSYIQREMGGGMMPNVGMAGAGAAGQYSTAAPAGYQDPFGGMTSGMRGGVPQNMAQAQSYMSQMQMSNPQLFNNMMAQRGVNPADFGVAGSYVYPGVPGGNVGGTGGGQGQGAPPPASSSPQATQSARRAAGPPDPVKGGAPTGSEDPGDPGEPHPDAPGWQHAAYAMKSGARQALNEVKAGGGKAAWAARGLDAAGAAIGKMGASDAAGGGGSLGKIGKGLGIAGMGIAAGVGLNNTVQRLGEEYTRYSQLGSVQGGGAAEGFGYEMQARMKGFMDPTITTDQQRQMMQLGLTAGYRGDQFQNSQEFMAKNFKELGMTFEQSSKLYKTAMEGAGLSGKSWQEVAKDTQQTLLEMKTLSKKGGADLTTRTGQLSSAVQSYSEMGVSSEAAGAATKSAQESYPDNRVLRENLPSMEEGAYGDERAALMIGQEYGIKGVMPEEIPELLEEKGINLNEAYVTYLKKMALGSKSAALFRRQANALGFNLTYKQALNLYKEAHSGKDPVKTSRDSLADGGRQTMGTGAAETIGSIGQGLIEQVSPLARIGHAGEQASSGDWMGAAGTLFNPISALTGATDAISGLFDDDKTPVRPSTPSRSGGASATPSPAIPQSGGEGKVSGEVRITVDQNGRVSAPQAIQLTGTQRAVNAGVGSSTLNGPTPGDPSYYHAYNNWGGGGG